jgi:hypothetical protein
MASAPAGPADQALSGRLPQGVGEPARPPLARADPPGQVTASQPAGQDLPEGDDDLADLVPPDRLRVLGVLTGGPLGHRRPRRLRRVKVEVKPTVPSQRTLLLPDQSGR